jgi:hypothetical protein
MEANEGRCEPTLGKRKKIIHPEGVAEFLSRSRKVRTQIPNKSDFIRHPQSELGLAFAV